jgi:hypothetical protein
VPLIEALRTALDDDLRRLSPKSEAAKAIAVAYGRRRWTAHLNQQSNPLRKRDIPNALVFGAKFSIDFLRIANSLGARD